MICFYCGEEFHRVNKNQKYCSEECRNKYWNNKKRLSRYDSNVRVDLVEAMKIKYASINIDDEIDLWILGGNK